MLLGAPLRNKRPSKVAGVVEIATRHDAPADERDALLKIVGTMAAVTAGSRAMSSVR